MPPSSTRLGPGLRGQRPGFLPQFRPRGRALAGVLAIIFATAPTPAAAADLERFLTHEAPADVPRLLSFRTGLSGQTTMGPAGPSGQVPAAGPTSPSGQVPAAEPTGPSGQVTSGTLGPFEPPRSAEPAPLEPALPGPAPASAGTSTPVEPAPLPATVDRDPPVGPRLGPGGELRVFGGMHQPTFGVALAFDWAFRRAALGVEVDYAAWLSLDQVAMHPGAIHLAALGLHRIPLGRLSLRQRLALGPAILLADVGPHRAGRTGLFFEAAPLGLEVHTRLTRVTFVLDAFSLALSAPVLGPDLAAQFQYRATIGMRS